MGKVIGTQDATPLEFWMLLEEGEQVQMDDAVVVDTTTPDGETLQLFGMIDIIRARHQGSTYDSDVVEAEQGLLPVELSIAAHVRITRILPEFYYPPIPGRPVRVVRGEEFAQALFMDKMERKFPIGLSLSGKEVVYGNLDFLTGRKGAHVNISGVSGIATKTTYTTFLLHSLLHCGALPDPANTHAIIFNVKGEDLLFLDKPNKELGNDDIEQYAQVGLPPEPFDSVQFYVPPAEEVGDSLLPNVGERDASEVIPYFWTVHQFCKEGLLRYLFTEVGEDASLLSTLVYQVEHRLRVAAEKGTGPGVWLPIKGKEEQQGEGESEGATEILNFSDLVAAIEILASSTNQATGTINAFIRRLYGAKERVSSLIRAPVDSDPEKHSIQWQNKQVTVVSITDLHEVGKSFVVGSVLQQIQKQRERTGSAERPCFIVVDELNRYAPRDGWSPIRDKLLEISERGRSSGIILIGAQQTASEVERRIVANPAFRIVGRLDAAESERAEYGFLPPTLRKRATILTSGRMIISQPDIPTPIPICFPMPAWATRAAEQDEPLPDLNLVKKRRHS